MKSPFSALLFCVLATACSQDGRSAEMNSAFTSAVLDRYAPGLRFGQEILGSGSGSAVEETDTGSLSGSAMTLIPVPRDGFTHVRMSGRISAPPRSRAASVAHRIVFFPLSTSQDQVGWRNAVAAIDTLFGDPARQGCAVGRLVRIMDRAYVWEQPGGGGAVLLVPNSQETTPGARVARLILFPRGVHAKTAVQGLEMRPCGS